MDQERVLKHRVIIKYIERILAVRRAKRRTFTAAKGITPKESVQARPPQR